MLSPAYNFRQRSSVFRHEIGDCQAIQDIIQLLLQTVKALENRDPGLIDGDERLERHAFDGVSFVNDVLREEVALNGFAGENLGQLIERDCCIHHRQPARPWARSEARSLLSRLCGKMLEYGIGQNLLHDGITDRTATDIVRAAVKKRA